MAGAAVNDLDVHVATCGAREAFKEIVDQFALQIADLPVAHLRVNDRRGATSKINRGERKRFIHRHQKVAGAQNASFSAERQAEGFTQRDPDILDGVVLIYVEITPGVNFEIKRAVAGKQLEHVIEEAYAGRDAVPAMAIHAQLQPDARF